MTPWSAPSSNPAAAVAPPKIAPFSRAVWYDRPVASTEKISLSLETGALLLARRAAEIEGLSLSAWMSRLVLQHAWASQLPRLTPEQQARADEHAAALDEQEITLWDGGGQPRATG